MKWIGKILCGILVLLLLILTVQVGSQFWTGSRLFNIDNQPYDVLFENPEEAQHYHLEFLYKYPQTNYIILHFQTHERLDFMGGQKSTVYTRKIFWIDEALGKRVLEVEYQDYENTVTAQSWYYSYDNLSAPVFLRMDDEVVLITHYNRSSGMNPGKNPGVLAYPAYLTSKSESDQIGIRPNGETIDMQAYLNLRAVFGSNHFIIYNEASFQTMLYTLIGNDIQLTTIWEKFPLSSYVMKLDGNTFFAHSLSRGTFPPQADYFFMVNEDPPKAIPTGFQQAVSTIHHDIKNISLGRTEYPAMILVQYPGSHFAVYEVSHKEIAHQDTASSIYKKLYEYKDKPPFAVMNQNQILVCSDSKPKFMNPNVNTDVIFRDKNLFYTEKQTGNDGKPDRFDSDLQQMDIPENISGISIYPYNDTHLLLYGGNAVWTMKWDWTELMQVFPIAESGQFYIYPRAFQGWIDRTSRCFPPY